MSDPIELVAEPRHAGARLDAVLAGHPEVASRSAAQRLIDDGRVTVDGAPRPKGHRLAGGERIVAAPAVAQGAEAPDPTLEIVHEDEQLLVVDKPAGVVVHPAGAHRRGTLAQALAGRAAGGGVEERAGIVHRLDRDTSGLLVVAKSEPAHRALQGMIRARELRREYLALVTGRPESERGTIDAAIGRDRRRRTAVSTRTDRPRPAVTHFWTLERLPRTTLLGVRLETGRTHQIRTHLSEIGHPVCGDRQYGGAGCGERVGLTRQFLHASRLRFRHPLTGEPLDCESKPPAELRRALDAARREPVPGGPDGG
jgi:23S rRNA pseudouridine1911/1915/1917 synthase